MSELEKKGCYHCSCCQYYHGILKGCEKEQCQFVPLAELKQKLQGVEAWYEKNKSKAVFMHARFQESNLNPQFFINTKDMDELRKILGQTT